MFSSFQSVIKCRNIVSISSFKQWTSKHCVHNSRHLHIAEFNSNVSTNKKAVFLKPTTVNSNCVNNAVIYFHICRFKSFDFTKKGKLKIV